MVARLPERGLGLLVLTYVVCAGIALVLVTAFIPVDDRIALPLDLGVVTRSSPGSPSGS